MIGNNYRNYESCNLDEWIKTHSSENDMKELFLNMDKALKYIHEHDYCINDFSPTQIDVLENRPDYVQFVSLIQLSPDPIRKKKMINEDIFNSSIIQICYYLHIPLSQLNIEFLKENFDSFAQFLPSENVPYYRGVIQRGASVYLCEYDVERRNRDLINLENELGENVSKDKSLVKENNRLNLSNFNNNRINDTIYKQISGIRDSAFINYLLVPTICMFTLLLMCMIGWVLSLI